MEQRWSSLLVFLAAILSVVAQEWGYSEDDGPDTWPRNYPSCGGQRQSPINLPSRDRISTNSKLCWCTFTFQGYSSVTNANVTNNGHTVNTVFQYSDPSRAPRAIVQGCEQSGTYTIQNIHFHWPSEHTVHHISYPLEMHIVHTNAKTKQNLVLGFFFQACMHSQTNIEKFASRLDQMRNKGDSVRIENVSPDDVLVPVDGGFYAYLGSLTTPPCSENVIWLVHGEPICIRQETLNKFYDPQRGPRNEEGEPMAGNNRPVQERNGREVCYISRKY